MVAVSKLDSSSVTVREAGENPLDDGRLVSSCRAGRGPVRSPQRCLTPSSGPGRNGDPDATLVDAARAGNIEAFETLVRHYQTRMVNFALAIVRDVGEAEDVAQETFLRAYRSLARFRGESSFKTWLYTIATNTARSTLDRRSRRERVSRQSLDDERLGLAADQVPDGLSDAESTLVRRQAIDQALAMLSDEFRVAVVLRDVEGLDYKEIARVTGAPVGTVESRIFRARQRLRMLLRSLMSAELCGR